MSLLFKGDDGSSACIDDGGSGSGTDDPGYTSSVIVIDNGEEGDPHLWDGGILIDNGVDPPYDWDGTIVISNPGDFPNGGGNGITSISGNGPGGVSSVTVSSTGEAVGMVVFLANPTAAATVTVNQSSSIALSGNGAGGGGSSSVNVSSLNGLVGLIVYNANESGGSSTTNNNYTTTSIDLSSVNGVKVAAQSATSSLNVHQTNNPTTIGVSGYDTADVKITLDGEVVTTTGSTNVTNFPPTPANQNMTVVNQVGVSGIVSANVVQIVPISVSGFTTTVAVSGVVGVSGTTAVSGSVTVLNPQTTIGISSITTTIPVSGIIGVSGGLITQVNNPTSIAISGSDGLGSYDAQVSSMGGIKGLIVHVANQIPPATIISAILVSGLNTGSFPVIVSSINPNTTVTGTIAVSGVVGVSGTTAVSGSVTVLNPQVTFGLSSSTTTIAVSGVVGVSGTTAVSGTVSISNFPASVPNQNVTVTNRIGVSSMPTSGSFVLTTSSLGGVAVSSTSALLCISFSATVASSMPQDNVTLVAAPGASWQIVVYGVNGYIVASAATIQTTFTLTKGNLSATNIIHIAGAYGQLGLENFSWQSFHGAGCGDNTALKYSLWESGLNGLCVASVHYRVERA